MIRILNKYNNLFKNHPYRTNLMSMGLLFGVGDVLAQYLFPQHDNWQLNYGRTTRAVVYGSFIFSPCNVFWYVKKLPQIKNPFISQYRAKWTRKRVHLADTVYRVAIDQLFVPGLIFIPLYNVSMALLSFDPHPWQLAKERLQNNWFKVLTTSWTVWPVFQMFNMFYIPVHLRVVCSNVYGVSWSCFLSYMANKDRPIKNKLLEKMVEVEEYNEEIEN